VAKNSNTWPKVVQSGQDSIAGIVKADAEKANNPQPFIVQIYSPRSSGRDFQTVRIRIFGARFFQKTSTKLILESETFWGRNQAEDLRFSLARRSAKATHSSTSFLSRL
jgi:hypothetical protein